MKIISHTQSLCPKCMQPVPAEICESDDQILMHKECARHGRQDVVISSDAKWYHRTMSFYSIHDSQSNESGKGRQAVEKGCPYDCGYCSRHGQRLYLPVAPVTSACNLNCPVCYTINKNIDPYVMSKAEFSAILNQIKAADPDMQIINFTGGEPLLHPEFIDFVRMCHDAGIHRITISTNGLVFLTNESLLAKLTELDARIVFSFNSFQSMPYQVTAGVDLLDQKLQILRMLEQYKPSTTLLTVVASGVNDREIGEIIKHILKSDFILSSEIHTVTLTGQSVNRFNPAARLTTPDVIADIVAKNPGIKMDDFLPSPCAHPLCYSTCYLLKLNNNEPVPFTKFISEGDMLKMLTGNLYIEPTMSTEEVLTDAMNTLWSREEPGDKDRQILLSLRDLLNRIFPPQGIDVAERQRVAERSTKAIYIHSHMDADNFDLARINQCCVAVPDGKGRNIPTCAYNNIYRAQDPHFSVMAR